MQKKFFEKKTKNAFKSLNSIYKFVYYSVFPSSIIQCTPRTPFDIGLEDFESPNEILKKGLSTSQLASVFEKRSKIVNAEIIIQNIHARAMKSLGEFHKSKSDRNRVSRLTNTLEILGYLTEGYHRLMNYSKDGTLYPKHENHLTRLVTDEFSFYTYKTPLSVEEFSQVLSMLEHLASELNPNIILILSSFPVVYDQTVFNMLVHVQSGPSPRIHTFSKTAQASGDPVFNNTQNFNLIEYLVYNPESSVPFMANVKGVSFSTNSIVLVKTLKGAYFYDLIDICLDHALGVAARHFEERLRERIRNQILPLVVEQVSHVITSSSTTLCQEHCIGEKIMHADPAIHILSPELERFHQKMDQGQVSSLMRRLKNKIDFDIPNLELCEKDRGICLKDPEFGASLVFNMFPPESLDRLPKRFTDIILNEIQKR